MSLVLNQMSQTEKHRIFNHSFTHQQIFLEPLLYARLSQLNKQTNKQKLGTAAEFGLLTIALRPS